MSTRTKINPQAIIGNNGNTAATRGTAAAAADMSQTSITSDVTILGSCTGCSFDISWTGTSPVGTIAFEVSNTYVLNPDGRTVKNAGNWTPIYILVNGTPAANIAISGNTGTAFCNIADIEAYAIRSVYTKGSGVGTLQATINGKVS